MSAAQTHRERLTAYIRSNLEFVAEYPAHTLALVQIITASHYRAPGVGQFVDAFEALADQLRAGQQAGEFGEFDPRVMATAIRGAIDATVGQFTRDRDTDLEAAGRELAEAFDRSTRPHA